MTILDDLARRGIIAAIPERPPVDHAVEARSPVVACFDAANGSLDVDELPTLVALARLQRAGHRPIIVLRGAVALVREAAVPCAELAPQVDARIAALRAQLGRVLPSADPATEPAIVDDRAWVGSVSYLQFLRDAGKYLSVNYLTERPSIADREELSYAELAVLLVAAFDVVHAASTHDATLCIGGPREYDVLAAAVEMARRMGPALAAALVAPLDAAGAPSRDATGEPPWLDGERTTPYQLYQHWLNAGDDAAARLVRMFSPRPLDEVDALLADHDRDRAKRGAQRHLAATLTTWIHGETALVGIEAANRIMFGGAQLKDLSAQELELLTRILPTFDMPRAELAAGLALSELLARAAVAASRGAARRLITQGGIYINGAQIKDPERRITDGDLATPTMLVVRSGKKNYHLLRVV